MIDLSIGSSDLPPPEAALEALRQATLDPRTYRYPLFSHTAPLRQAAARYLERRYGLSLDPDTELLPLIGAQEGLAHLLLAVTDPGDTLLLPDPCYPPYYGAAAVAGLNLAAAADGRARLSAGSGRRAGDRSARALLLNYPNNPTSATVPDGFFAGVRAWCAERGTLLIHDHPYAELTYGGYRAPSALDGGTAGVVELHSLSKSHHMGGFRVGFAAGDPEPWRPSPGQGRGRLSPLAGHPGGGGGGAQHARQRLEVFQARRDALVPALHALGWEAEWPQASMYVWARPPGLTTAWRTPCGPPRRRAWRWLRGGPLESRAKATCALPWSSRRTCCWKPCGAAGRCRSP